MPKKSLFLILLMILFPNITHALSVTDCVYNAGSTNIFVTYKSDYSINYDTNKDYVVSGNLNYLDFSDSNGNFICPKISIKYQESENTTNARMIITKYIYGDFDFSEIKDTKMLGKLNQNEKTCNYESSDVNFTISFSPTNIDYKCKSESYIYCGQDGKYKYISTLRYNDFFDNNSNEICPTIAYKKYGKSFYIYNYVDYTGQRFYSGKVVMQSTIESNSTTTTTKKDLFETNCADFSSTIKIGGIILLLAKIILPFIIIVKISIKMFSVITKGTPEEFKTNISKMVISFIAAVLIFFTPTIVNVIIDAARNIRGETSNTSDIEICEACLFEPLSDKCKKN